MKRTLRILASLPLLALAVSTAHARDLPNYDASFARRGPAPQLAVPRATAALRARVAATDPRTGAPSFVWAGAPQAVTIAPGTRPDQAARLHVVAHAPLFGLSLKAIEAARVAHVHDTGSGPIVVVLRQEIGGVPLYQHDQKVLLRRDLSLVALSGSLHPLAVPGAKSAAPFALPAAGAVARALSDLYATSIPSSVLAARPDGRKDDYRRFDLAAGQVNGVLRLDRPARARKVYFPLADRLVPAYYVEVFATEKGASSDAYAYVIAADSGDVLQRHSLRADAAFKYRVWAEPSGNGRPFDGPVADFTPHPTGVPDGSFPDFVAPNLVTMDGFDKNADPWLPEAATQSKGNNVDAYTDHDDTNVSPGPGDKDVHADVTAPGEFDRTYDTSKGPLDSVDQEKAAVAQLFYTTNWLHDYWYDSGFDEAAGNAQADNYGRGGSGNDPLLAEAQDAYDKGARSNANMETPDDGESPRMQMYVWAGREDRSVESPALPPKVVTNAAEFGPQTFDVNAQLGLADDGVDPASNGCEAFKNDLSGKIALVDRGQCTFHEKALNAQAAGAVGMILANNQAGAPPYLPKSNFPDVSIPSMSITQADGMALKTALAGGPVQLDMHRVQAADVDGTIDNLIVSHEWGHYLHHRLVTCNLNQCGGESEGWGDFVALTTQLREKDDLDGAFSDSTYAAQAFDNFGYFGVRRFPYSVDMKKNPLTFQHIQQSATLPNSAPMAEVTPDNSEVHNTGEIWATMLFEGFVAILEESKGAQPKYTFEQARRKMADYVVAGLKLAPGEPTFLEQRDAIIAAAYAADPDDAFLIAQGFAKRGAGSCAEGPPKDSLDNNGVAESYVVAPAVFISKVTLDDTIQSCDKDNLLDAGETGKLTVTLANKGYQPAPGTEVKITTMTPGVVFPNGATATVAELGGFGTQKIELPVKLDPAQKMPYFLDLTVTATNDKACNPKVVKKVSPRVNYDNALAASTTDDFESDVLAWQPKGKDAGEIWTHEAEDSGNHVWHGVDFSSLSDTSLTSRSITVSASDDLVISWKHRHKFENGPQDPQDPQSPIVNWDGAVVEISADNGASWEDVSKYGKIGYSGKIGNLAKNPLADRDGFTDQNPSWPKMDPVSVNLGKAFAGKTVLVRFRIGSDEAASAFGWVLDDVAFTGIVGEPFPQVVPDAQSCAPVVDHAPVANAGPDQAVESGAMVTLDASESSDPDGDELAFDWSELSGPQVSFTADGAKLTFQAPEVTAETEITFAVKVTAKELSSIDTVKIVVKPAKGAAEAGTDKLLASGGCGCSVPGGDGDGEGEPLAPIGALGLVGIGVMASRRRRGRRS
jgi:MYXO-CTERM domain-containing protein